MGDNGAADVGDRPDNHPEIAAPAPPRSPWKTSSAASPVTGADSATWPALSDAQQRSKCNGGVGDVNSAKSPPPPPPAGTDGCDDPPTHSAPVTGDHQKFHGRGNFKSPRRPNATNHNKNDHKHGPNNIHPYIVPVPYYPPIIPGFPTMVPISPTPVPGYAYQFPPRPFPRADGQLVKPGSDPAPAYIPPMNENFQPSPRADPSGQDSGSGGIRHGTNEQYGQMNHSRNNQRPASNNFYMQPNLRPRPFIRPPYFSPAVPPEGMYYYQAAPLGSVRGPYQPFLVQYPLSPGVPVPAPTIAVSDAVVKQIEYYFSDENLQHDVYLLSLMDSQGWVPMSIIADFKRVKRMNVDIPFILDALQASETIEVQGEKVRRRNEWSKWIPKSLNSESASVVGKAENNDQNENKRDSTDDKITESLPSYGRPVDSLPLIPDDTSNSVNNSTKLSKDGEEQMAALVNSASRIELNCQTNFGDSSNVLNTESNNLATSLGAEPVKLVASKNDGNKGMQVLSNRNANNFGESSNDFSSTFMLDEELEMEQNLSGHDHPSTAGRVDDEDEEILINDQAVERLVIVTQNSQIRSGKESQTLSSELASAINDGLFYYEQELNSKSSRRRHNKPNNEDRVEKSGNSAQGAGTLNSRILDRSTGKSSSEGPGNPSSRRKQNKGTLKQQQRLFYGIHKCHGTGRNTSGVVSESPPKDAVGFFFGSTPPDSHGFKHSKLSASPQSNLSGSSPPVGSVPKSFPPFQHPSHKLLEENGFKQQL